MTKKEKRITESEIKEGLNKLYPDAIKKIEIEEDEEPNTFFFEIEFKENFQQFETSDGLFIGFVDFKKFVLEGVIDGPTFLEAVKEA